MQAPGVVYMIGYSNTSSEQDSTFKKKKKEKEKERTLIKAEG